MIHAKSLRKVFGTSTIAVDSLSFELGEGQTLALIGTSGCGKTTTLKMLNRLVEPSSGQIEVLGKNILEQDPVQVRRHMGYVIQGGGLFPHWSVERNIGLVPSLLDWPAERIADRVEQLLQLVDLDAATYRQRFPAELSGGQRQRVGICRALAGEPPVVLLDEPFSALDPITREQLQQEFLRLKQIVKKTMVFVTHDIKEAFLLADQVIVMDEGVVQQQGTPEEIRARPASEFVRRFVERQGN